MDNLNIKNKNDCTINSVPFALVDNTQSEYTDVFIFSEIDNLTYYTIINRLENIPKDQPLKIHISSEGGDVISGFKIAEFIKTFDYVEAYIEGVCFSIATLIALSSNKIYMTKNSFFLIHNPFTAFSGDAEQMEATAETLRNIENKLIDTYINKTNLDEDVIKNIMKKEEWMTSDRAIELGFVDEIIDDRYNMFNFKNIFNIFKDNIPRSFVNDYKKIINNKGDQNMDKHNTEDTTSAPEETVKAEVTPEIKDEVSVEEPQTDTTNEVDVDSLNYKQLEEILSEIKGIVDEMKTAQNNLLEDIKNKKEELKEKEEEIKNKVDEKEDDLEINYTSKKTMKVGNKVRLNYPSMLK